MIKKQKIIINNERNKFYINRNQGRSRSSPEPKTMRVLTGCGALLQRGLLLQYIA